MNKKKIVILFLASLTVLVRVQSNAMDYPHNNSETVSCEDCHYVWGSEPSLLIEGLTYGQNIDDTQYNALCWSCHQPLDATPVETHSSLQTDNGYGDWTVECIECHDVHANYQFRTYGSPSYVYQGTVSSVDATTLTLTGAGWSIDEFKDLVLIPNVVLDYNNYRITGNTGDTLTVAGTIDLTGVNPGDTFAIIYGKLVKDTINTPSSGAKTVRFFDSTGINSFADGDATYDGVCEVCHTQTSHHRNDASGDHAHNAGTDCMTCHQHIKGFKAACDVCHGNPPVVNTATGGPDGLANTPGVTGSSTAGAHNVHVNAKSYGCVVCHYDSVGTGATHNNGLTVTMGFYSFGGAYQGGSYDGQSGVSYNATTTSPVTSVSSNNNKTCSNIYCHSTGQSTLSGGDSTPTYASPVWDDPASGVCGTCHKVNEGAGLTSGSHGAHLGTTGVAGCSECHTGAENDASAYTSGNHVNALIDVANSYDSGGSPGNGYGKCSTGRCHDDGTGNPEITPEWGLPGAGCSECHVDVPATGSHVKHVTTTNYNTADCGDCHDGAVRNTTPPAQHLDADIDVYDSSPGDLGYAQDVAKGGPPYDSCSTAYCHSPGQASDGGPSPPAYATVLWGDTAACGTCHEVNEGTGLTSGSHGEHLGTTGVNGCSDCHTDAADDASSYNSSSHVDGSIDVANTYSAGGAPGNGYGICSAASCHDDGTGTLVDTSAWGTDDANCESCHTAAPATGSHTEHLSANRICADCHKGAVQGTTAPVEHLDDDIDVYETNPGDLNYTADKSKGSAYESCSNIYCHGDYAGSGLNASPTWGNASDGDCGTCHGAPTTALPNDYPSSGSHTEHASGIYGGFGPAERQYACSLCHKNIVSGGPADYTIIDKSRHVNGFVDWEFDTSDTRIVLSPSPSYNVVSGTEAPTDGILPDRNYGQCSNIYCHSTVQSGADGTGPPTYVEPLWGTNDTCGFECHPAIKHFISGGENKIASGSHTKHLAYKFGISNEDSYPLSSSYKGVVCTLCHKWDSSSPFDTDPPCANCHDDPSGLNAVRNLHVNGTIDVLFDPTFVDASATYNDPSGTPGNGYFDCSNTYCHSDGTGGTAHTGDNRGVTSNLSPTWGTTGPLACDSCHDGTATGPSYPNGTPKANSHEKHTALYNCNTCHADTVDAGNNISSNIKHVNKLYDIFGTLVPSYSYQVDGGTCSTAACHGDSTPKWGGTVSCSDCHLGTGDVDDYTYNNATLAKLDSTEWQTQGHGKASAPLPLDCAYCHDNGVAHDTATNPFRLANYDVGGNGWNDTCFICHKTGSAGYDPGSGNKTSSVKIDKFHQMTAHSQSGNNGGKFCWDCHDPHGDGNIKMIQARPAKTTDGTFGIPSTTPVIDVVFTNNAAGTGAGGFARTGGLFEQGICNACHTASASNPKMQHYTSTSSDSHNSDQVCTNCHDHSGNTTVNGQAFEGSGGCDACHAYPPAIGDGKQYRTAEQEGKGAHAKHVNHLESLWGGSLDAGTDQFGSGASWTNVCGVCHNGATHNTTEAIPGTGRTIAFPAGYQFGPGASSYNGTVGISSNTTMKSCSNISCHFKESPGWQDPVTAGN